MKGNFFVYILRNNSGNFYTGITNDLVKRIWEHKNKISDGFTKKYNMNKLIYYEIYKNPQDAINKEKQIKKLEP